MDTADIKLKHIKKGIVHSEKRKSFTPLPAFQEIRSKMDDFYARPDNAEKYYHDLLKIISKSADVDLSHYRDNYLHRRLYYRILRLNINSYREYLEHIRLHPEEVQNFIVSFTIHVTSFFRDDKPFQFLENELLPKIANLKDNSYNKTIRILSAPCSTGEESYSLAIIADNLKRANIVKNPIEIYACDLDQKSLDFAQIGIYDKSTLKSLDDDSIKRNFTQKTENTFQIKAHLKNYITYFSHDLLKPLPYRDFDLIVCRNFLIYISKDRQQVVLNNLTNVFRNYGYLMLGKTEGFPLLSSHIFGSENLKEHIYYFKGNINHTGGS